MSKQLNIGPKYLIFPIKHGDICDYNPRYFISSGLIIDDIIMDLFSDITEQKKDLFTKINDDEIYLYRGSLQDYSWKEIISDTKNTLRTHHFIEK